MALTPRETAGSFVEVGEVGYSVGQVARLSGVTVRALHHYDEIGLLPPGSRTAAGYRDCSDADLDRLRRILFYRALDFTFDDLADILADGDAATHSRRQRGLLSERLDRLRRMLAAVERELEASTMGIELTQEEKFELFGDFDLDDHAWGSRTAMGRHRGWEQSQRRVRSFAKQAWADFTASQEDIHVPLAEALRDGVPADGERARDLAEQHRGHITNRCYDCSYEIHRGLGERYLADARYRATYEEIELGLARFGRDGIIANAERAEA